MLFDNAKYISLLIKRAYYTLIAVIALQAALILFFAWQWYSATRIDHVYIIDPDTTRAATRADGTLHRSQYEIKAFILHFLEKAFAHNEYSWGENLRTVSDIMDKKSAQLFLARMNEEIEALYKEQNAISTVALKDIEIDTQKHPYEVLLYYETHLNFAAPGTTVYDSQVAEGGLFLEIHPMSRCPQNPFGMQIRNLQFLQKKAP